MQKNVGGYDRIARFVAGPILLIVGLMAFGGLLSVGTGTIGTAIAGLAVLVGAVFIVTAMTQKCPLNSILGLNTYREKTARESEPETGGTRPKAE